MGIMKENFNSHLFSKDGIRKRNCYLPTWGQKHMKIQEGRKQILIPHRCLLGEEIFKPNCRESMKGIGSISGRDQGKGKPKNSGAERQ